VNPKLLLAPFVLCTFGISNPSVGWCQQSAEEELASLESRIESGGTRGADRYRTYTSEFLDLIRLHPGTDVALRAKLWIIQHTRYEQNWDVRVYLSERFAEEVLAEFSDSPRMVRLAELSYVFLEDERRTILGRLATDSPHAEVRGEALLGLARLELETWDPEAVARGKERLAELVAQYGDVPWRYTTFGTIADALLHPHDAQSLAIGAVAPDISGQTHNGKPVSLKALKGRVVILEFWGEW
jgi:hypothetical protein